MRRRLRSCRGAAAFTLIEVIAALGISLILMAAVYGAFLLYSRIMVTAARPIDQGQISRAILSQIARDLKSVVYRPPEATTQDSSGEAAAGDSSSSGTESGSTNSGTGGTSGAQSATSGTTTTTGTTGAKGASGTTATTGTTQQAGTAATTEPTEEETTTGTAAPTLTSGNSSLGLVGNANTLVMHVSRPERGLSYSAASGATSLASRTSDLLSVSYFLASRGGGGLAGTVGENVVRDQSLRESDGYPVGLARLEGDRLAIEHADIESDDQAMAAASQLIAAEVVVLEFRYYDGAAWVTEWDTAAQGRLPHAVEVKMGFRPPKPRPRPGERSAAVVSPVTEYVTHVLEVPLAGSYAALSAP
jgi:prepilin-type N-terminal cleavage/methylation domain-containing protein